MKRERALVEKRRQGILEQLEQDGEVKAEELAAIWKVSQLTIRRDLKILEELGRLERFYGGAVRKEVPAAQNTGCMYSRLISKYAAALVEDGDTIFINTSMTALRIVEHLGDKRVTVITNNGRIMNMEVPPSVSVLLSGGELRYPKYAMVGEYALRNLSSLAVKKSFIGCSGITPERGMTTELMNEVHVNRLMLEQVAGKAYILADHRKIGHDSSFVSREISGIQNLITDECAGEDMIARFRDSGVNVYQVKREESYGTI